MRAMILAAGKGERMRPLTLHRPKPLLEVADKPLLVYHLERLRDAGIRELVVNVSWLGEQIVEHIGSGERWGLAIQYSREEEPLETAGGIVRALPLLGDAPFIVINADVWTDFDCSTWVSSLSEKSSWVTRDAHLLLVPNPEHHPQGDFSLVDRSVHRRGENPVTFAGIAAYHPRFFAECAGGVQALLPLFLNSIDKRTLAGELYCGVWQDVGTPARLDELDRAVRDNQLSP
ncbi:MAG: N-acetylmuramate alpha-1-phosphate uridylyltransferase MurU [Pseudomonadota bacterium]